MSEQKDSEFHSFWESCPLKVGKLATEKEYWKARKIASADAILEGLEKYKRTKPEWQHWAHPRTWLHQGRWLDQVEEAPKKKVAGTLQNWWD